MAREVIPSGLKDHPPGDLPTRMYLLEGRVARLETQMESLFQEIREESDEVKHEQRTVHNIVEMTNESIRNVAKDVAEMKPHVREYSFAALDLKQVISQVKQIKEREAEERGAQRERAKTRAIVIGALGVIGTGMTFIVSKFVEWLFVFLTTPRPK